MRDAGPGVHWKPGLIRRPFDNRQGAADYPRKEEIAALFRWCSMKDGNR